jgi:hypothetical protein
VISHIYREGRPCPARLLATAASRRELATADSVAEVIAWRIDAFLADNPEPALAAVISPEIAADGFGPALSAACPAYESAARARERLTALTLTTLGAPLAVRAQSEDAWPALIAALRRAENTGYCPADALTRVATARQLCTARSISEVLAWRINRYVAAHPAEEGSPVAGSLPASLLPWISGPRQVPLDGEATPPLVAYLDDAAALISARVSCLAAPASGSATSAWSLPTVTSTRSPLTTHGRSSVPTPSPATQATTRTGTPPNPSCPPASSPDSNP